MPTDPVYVIPDDGTLLNASDITVNMDGVEDSINALPEYALDTYALNPEHVPGFCCTYNTLVANLHVEHAPAAIHLYSNTYPGYNVFGVSPPPVGAGAGALTRRIISDGVTPLQLTFNNIRLDQGRVRYFDICANIELARLYETGVAENGSFVANFAILWRDSTATWHILTRTERFQSMQSAPAFGTPIVLTNIGNHHVDVAIKTKLLPADTFALAVDRIAVAVSFHDPTGTAVAPVFVELRRGALTAIPIYAEVA